MWSSLTSYSPPRSTLHQMIYWVHITLLSLLVLCVLLQFSFHTSHLHLICIPYFYIYFLLLCHTPSENISHGRRASTSPYLNTPSFPVRAPPTSTSTFFTYVPLCPIFSIFQMTCLSYRGPPFHSCNFYSSSSLIYFSLFILSVWPDHLKVFVTTYSITPEFTPLAQIPIYHS